MARTRSRRRVGRRIRRNAKGHFVKRAHTTRRRRRNPMNPSGFVKVGRRWRKITTYAKRRRRGSRRGQIRGFKFPRRYRRSRARRNPIAVTNPRRRRTRRNPHRRSHRRSYARRNPSGARSFRLSSDPIKAVKEAIMSAFSGDTMETLFHLGLGFGSVIPLSRLLIKNLIPTLGTTPYGRVGGTLGVALLGTALAGLVTKDQKLTSRFLAGGLLATLWQGLSEFLPVEAKAYIPTLGAPETDEFRRAIEKEVLKELRGGVHGYLPAAGSEGLSTYLTPAGIEYLQPAGSEAYLTETGAERASSGMGAYLTEANSERASAGVGGPGGDFDEFARATLPERF
jgi:hypothetical protein